MLELNEGYLLTEEDNLSRLNFLGLTNCPMRQTFKDSLEEEVSNYYSENGKLFKAHIPLGCSCKADLENMWIEEDINKFPDVITSIGYNEIFYKGFKNKFLNNGFFRSYQMNNIHEIFSSIGCVDP